MAADNELLIKINGTAKQFIDEMDKVKKQTKEVNKVLTSVAKASAAAFAGLTAVIAGVTKVYADYETALVGVGKTTDISGKKLTNLGKRISGLSRSIPLATNELLGIAQAAGQLGVTGEDNLVKFTDTVAKLGVATDLTGEQAATSLTRILTVTGEGVENIDRFGSVIVRLGNNFAATESEIVKMTTEVSRAVGIFGVSATEAAGLSTALKAIGVRAELGGSAVGRAFRAISDSVSLGGKKLQSLEALTGRTGDELKRVFQDDAPAAFQIFIESLGNIPAEQVTAELAKFGLKGEEILKVLPALAQNSDLLARALGTAKKEFKDNTALANESQAAFDTLNSDTVLLKNEITAFAREIGAKLAPEIRKLVNNVREAVAFLTDMDESTKDNIATFLKWGAIVAAAVTTVATFAAGVVSAIGAFVAAKAALAGVGIAISALGGPITLAIAGVAALSFGLSQLFNDGEGENKPQKSLEQINQELEIAKKKQDELNKSLDNKSEIQKSNNVFLKAKQKELEALDKQIGKLEDLRKEQQLLDKDFGTGSLLLQAPGQEGSFDDLLPQIGDQPEQEVNAPLALNPEVREQEVKADEAKLKAAEDAAKARQAITDEAKNKRLASLADEQAKIKTQTELFNAQQKDEFNKRENDLLAKQAEFDIKKIDLAAERRAAQAIEDEAERAKALENVELKNAQLLEQETVFLEQAEQVRAEDRERKAELDEELRALELEQREALNAEDLAALQSKLLTEDEIERKVAKDKALRNIQERNKELEDRKRFGTTIATLNKFFNSEEVQGVKSTTTDLEQLRNSSSKTQQKIGKAAARVNAAVKTAEGAISAYTSLSGIPIVGPVLGAAAAAALTAYGVEQQQRISSAQRGGVIQDVPGSGGARDRVPALLEPGELVVPRALSPDFIQSVGRPEVGATTGAGGSFNVEIGLRDDLIDFVEDGLQERRALNITNEGIE